MMPTRRRTSDEARPTTPNDFRDALSAVPATNLDLASDAFGASGLTAFTVAVDGLAHTWRLDDGRLTIVDGDGGDGPRADLPSDWFSDIVNDVRTSVALMVDGAPVMTRGRIEHLIAWEPTLRALTDGRPAYQSGSTTFRDVDGAPLDLRRSFSIDDDPAQLRHFLSEAGFLVLRGVFDRDEMAALSTEMDRWFAQMTPDDNRSWYATAGGEQVCVRVTNLGRDAVRFPHEERLSPIAELVDHQLEFNETDLLVKPVGVDAGISDLPWHKDCELGLHSYRCPSLTCGVSVTASGPDNGQLGVVAGSHRMSVTMLDVNRVDLPVLYLDTEPGDVTVHVSCTLHCATPPIHSERRVTYTSFEGPVAPALRDIIRRSRDQAGRDTYAPEPDGQK